MWLITPKQLDDFMKSQRPRLKPATIDAEKGVSVTTVYRFLRGEQLNERTVQDLTEWAEARGFKFPDRMAAG